MVACNRGAATTYDNMDSRDNRVCSCCDLANLPRDVYHSTYLTVLCYGTSVEAYSHDTHLDFRKCPASYM